MNNSVDGTIIRDDKSTIYCELYTEPEHRFVNLPHHMFLVDKIRVGLPIRLQQRIVNEYEVVERKMYPQVEKDSDFFKFDF